MYLEINSQLILCSPDAAITLVVCTNIYKKNPSPIFPSECSFFPNCGKHSSIAVTPFSNGGFSFFGGIISLVDMVVVVVMEMSCWWWLL